MVLLLVLLLLRLTLRLELIGHIERRSITMRIVDNLGHFLQNYFLDVYKLIGRISASLLRSILERALFVELVTRR